MEDAGESRGEGGGEGESGSVVVVESEGAVIVRGVVVEGESAVDIVVEDEGEGEVGIVAEGAGKVEVEIKGSNCYRFVRSVNRSRFF